MKRFSVLLAAVGVLVLMVAPAGAALVDLGPGSFTPAASVITFSEVPLGTQNPVYNIGGNTVSFGSYFAGQAIGGSFPKTLTDFTPNAGPLALVLDPNYPTFTVMDGSNPSSPVLSGSPLFNGTISVLFATPVAAVGLEGGFFDAVHSTTIMAFAADGSILGSITNSITGLEFYGLFDSGGANIAGISFFITGPEPAGFAIDDLTFGNADVVKTPEPGTLLLLGSGLIGLVGLRRRS